jgi:hypothetical protein
MDSAFFFTGHRSIIYEEQTVNEIFSKIQTEINNLLMKEDYLYYSNRNKINKRLLKLMEEVAELSANKYPELGELLYNYWLELDKNVKVSDLLHTLYYIEDNDLNTSKILNCIMYLKLSVMCTFDKAIYYYGKLISKNRYNDVPHEDFMLRNLITIYNKGFSIEDVTEFDEFICNGLDLFTQAYTIHYPDARETKQYKFYISLISALNENIIPNGLIHGYDGDATTTKDMVNFLVEKFEEKKHY